MPHIPSLITETTTAEEASLFPKDVQIEAMFVAADKNYKLGKQVVEYEEETNRPISGYEIAERCFRGILVLDPNNISVLNNMSALGLVCAGAHGLPIEHKNQAVNTVLGFVERGLAINPKHPNLLCNKGVALSMLHRYQESIDILEQAVQIDPKYTDAHCDLGASYEAIANYDKAIEHYKIAVDVEKPRVEAMFNLSRMLIWGGDYINGWKMYEQRWNWDSFTEVHLKFNHCPRWDGEDLKGQTIVVYAEQGMGDTLQFVRYVGLLKGRYNADKVFILCPPVLKPLLENMANVDGVICVVGEIPAFDVQIPMMSLPYAFKATLETVPMGLPYLWPKRDVEQQWHHKLSEDVNRFKVGLCWAGTASHGQDHHRSMELDVLKPLLDADCDIGFVSLQKGARQPTPDQLLHFNMLDFSDQFTDIEQTAGLIANLDLVITVDTAMAHLAGAMGKRVWMLVSKASEFRWGTGTRTPWYPTMYIFRQRVQDDWRSVVGQVRECLRSLVKSEVKSRWSESDVVYNALDEGVV
jgi:tetratricopeptide (TPR) repeat protein